MSTIVTSTVLSTVGIGDLWGPESSVDTGQPAGRTFSTTIAQRKRHCSAQICLLRVFEPLRTLLGDQMGLKGLLAAVASRCGCISYINPLFPP